MEPAREAERAAALPARLPVASNRRVGGEHPLLDLQRMVGNRFVQRAIDDGTTTAIDGARSQGRPLDAAVRAEFETVFDRDLSSVRVHDDRESARLSHRLEARAFA